MTPGKQCSNKKNVQFKLGRCSVLNILIIQSIILTFECASADIVRTGRISTPLLNDDMPCLAENLRETERYICSDNDQVICLNGWTKPEILCREPLCSFEYYSEINGSLAKETKTGCDHGQCIRPDVCACEVGWQGRACDECIMKPGCNHKNGFCTDALECRCRDETKYVGPDCETPVCREGCSEGYCITPDECICRDGWAGELCDRCIPLPGCKHGTCHGKPLECECYPGWTGPLCDCPVCAEGCNMDHAFCTNLHHPKTLHHYEHFYLQASSLEDAPSDNNTTHDLDEAPFEGECFCYPGWSGHLCDQCMKYPGCPDEGWCEKPWDCFCPEGFTGSSLCNTTAKFDLLPDYYHHSMSKSCRNMNRFLSHNDHLLADHHHISRGENDSDSHSLFGNFFAFSPELVHGSAVNAHEYEEHGHEKTDETNEAHEME